VFDTLADSQGQVRYLKEDTVARFLEIPDVLEVAPVLFQMMTYIGSFPFLEDAPAILGLHEMIMVVTILTERYRRVLAGGSVDRRKLLFKSLAVYDRKLSNIHGEQSGSDTAKLVPHRSAKDNSSGQEAFEELQHGFAVDQPGDDEASGPDHDDDGDDDLVLAAFNSLDSISAFRHGSRPPVEDAVIPADNWRRLLMLLLLTAPLGEQESLSSYSQQLSGDTLQTLRLTANSVLAAFMTMGHSPGVRFSRFNTIIPASMPFLFNGLNALFEHFLFSKNLDFTKHKNDQLSPKLVQPLLNESGSIMNPILLSQISFFIPGSSIFRKVRLLYSGDEDGFSMGSFETKVFNWRAPTIFLVSGTRISDQEIQTGTKPSSAFLASLPSKRFPCGSNHKDETLIFGVYLTQPWKHTYRECFGNEDTLLFQLSPIHDVFRPSTLSRDYAWFAKPSTAYSFGGISFGCPPPKQTQASRRAGTIPLGPISLALDDSFEFGCFTHQFTSGGGAFRASVARRFDFQEWFEITNVEVWGCGGDEEAKIQAERWAWEAREAEARRRVNLGKGDIEADRVLLEMAGLLGGHRSGRSMG
jgi:TLD./Meiotically up-regulated C-terminal.